MILKGYNDEGEGRSSEGRSPAFFVAQNGDFLGFPEGFGGFFLHTNAPQAGSGPSAEQWPYSSFPQYTGAGSSKPVATEPLLELVGGIEGYNNVLKNYDGSQNGSAWDFIVKG